MFGHRRPLTVLLRDSRNRNLKVMCGRCRACFLSTLVSIDLLPWDARWERLAADWTPAETRSEGA